ncbi:MAG: hypothetical protein LQ340_008057, partial [Diploschistes diacapsis]
MRISITPFNIKLTIIEPNLEISVLPNKISAVPQLPRYANPPHPAPLQRAILGRILDRPGVTDSTACRKRPRRSKHNSSADGAQAPQGNESDVDTLRESSTSSSSSPSTESHAASALHSPFSRLLRQRLHPPPPSRTHSSSPSLPRPSAPCARSAGTRTRPRDTSWGEDGVSSVKEKLKTVSEELEDFVECSSGVDIEE